MFGINIFVNLDEIKLSVIEFTSVTHLCII